jgi:alanine racemase
MLYGASPFAEISAAALGLKPAMSLTAQIIALHEVPAGEGVGYGATWVAQRPSRVATVSCGYADGYPRHAPSGTPVVVRGQRVPLAGRVSMDMLAIDVTDLPLARIGDAVELWGAQLPVDEVAQASGTIGYELLSKVTARVRREYRP